MRRWRCRRWRREGGGYFFSSPSSFHRFFTAAMSAWSGHALGGSARRRIRIGVVVEVNARGSRRRWWRERPGTAASRRRSASRLPPGPGAGPRAASGGSQRSRWGRAAREPPAQPSRTSTRSPRSRAPTRARRAPATSAAASERTGSPRSTGRSTVPGSRGHTVITSRRGRSTVTTPPRYSTRPTSCRRAGRRHRPGRGRCSRGRSGGCRRPPCTPARRGGDRGTWRAPRGT